VNPRVNPRLTRRVSVAGIACGTLLFTIVASGCSSLNRNNDAARVEGHTLGRDEIGALVGNTDPVQDGAAVRVGITKWVRVELLEQTTGTADPAVASTANLDARLAAGLTALAAETPDAGRDVYTSGPAVSGVVCLGAIPVDPPEVADSVLADLAGGMSWADAATKYSSDAGLASGGGVVLDQDGKECIAAAKVNPTILDPIVAAGIDTPLAVNLGATTAVVKIRSYDELSGDAQLELARTAMNVTRLPALLATADVYIDPLYGVWNPATAEVDPLKA
jgi:hypothetical protein